MLSLALLLGKFLFLVVMYLFVFMVVRSGARDLKTTAGVSSSPSVVGPISAPPAALPAGPSDSGGPQAAWIMIVDSSPTLRVGSAVTLLPGERVVMGRAPESDVVLSDTFVSARHTAVQAAPDGLLIEDLGSTNGTFVDGREVEGTLFVGPGQRVSVGDTVFLVEGR